MTEGRVLETARRFLRCLMERVKVERKPGSSKAGKARRANVISNWVTPSSLTATRASMFNSPSPSNLGTFSLGASEATQRTGAPRLRG